MAKIWLVIQESKVDGEILFNTVPCANEEVAKKVMQDEIKILLNESHFVGYVDRPDDFIVEQTDYSYYIEDMCDDYYENICIDEKEILS